MENDNTRGQNPRLLCVVRFVVGQLLLDPCQGGPLRAVAGQRRGIRGCPPVPVPLNAVTELVSMIT